MNKRTLAGAGVVIFLISLFMGIFNLFFDNIFLTASSYVFFACLCLLALLIFYRLYQKIDSSRSPAKMFFTQKLNYTFQIFLIMFLLFLIINEFYKLSFINPTYFLILVIVLGILSILFPYEQEEVARASPILIFILGILGAVVIFIKTRELGWLSYIIAVVVFVMIMLLSQIIYEEDMPE